MGNLQVFFAVPGPVPVNNPYPLLGYRYSHGSVGADPRVHPYPHPRVYSYLENFNLHNYYNNDNKNMKMKEMGVDKEGTIS
jgi:hypothetical protein